MSILDKLFQRRPKGARLAPMLNGWAPIFSQFGTDIYASDVVQQALKCIVDEVKKLNPQHVRMNGADPVPIYDSTIQRVLENPNPLMTTSELLEKVTWLLLLNYNAFVIPVYRVWVDPNTGAERRYYEQLWPIQPTQVDFIEDPTGRLFVHFFFASGKDTTIPYDNVIHFKYNYSVNQYMGGNEAGQPDHRGILKTLQMNDDLLRGIAKAMKASYAVNGVVKYHTMIDEQKMTAALAEMTRALNNNESGFLPMDLKGDFIPLEHKSQIVSEETLRFIDEKILRTWGVPLCILTGDYTPQQYQAFYQKSLEGLVKSMSQSITKKVFTDGERSFGNRVELYPRDLVFMSNEQVLEMIKMLSPTGGLYENEKRTALGLRPLPELEGKRYMSLNWIDANDASQYQVGAAKNVSVDIVDKEDF